MWLLQIIKPIEQEQHIYFMTKVFDILLDPCHGLQMPRSQLQIRLQEPSIDYKNKFPKISERMEK